LLKKSQVYKYRHQKLKYSRETFDKLDQDDINKWKKKLPEWLQTKKLTPPDDL
jgi:hypothetical protein